MKAVRLGLAWLALLPLVAPAGAEQAPQQRRLAVFDIELTGDLGGPEFIAEHAARLALESARLRSDLERNQRYQVLDLGAARTRIEQALARQQYLYDCNGCDLDIGRALQADLTMVSWVTRVSGLILTLTFEIHDVASGQIVARRSFDFRGDNDTAWAHAVDYMVRHLDD